MKIIREKLIQFYDERIKEEGRGAHVSALTALWGEDLILGILMHYWKRQGIESQIISYACSTGGKKGPRLDAWILKQASSSEPEILYQVEVKNWSAYSWEGQELKLRATDKEIREHSDTEWNYYFGGDKIPTDSVSKVFTSMKVPNKHEGKKAIPLLCFWFYISDKDNQSLSIRRYEKGREVHVFSASAYLRSFKNEFIEIDMPRLNERLKLLNDMICPPHFSSP